MQWLTDYWCCIDWRLNLFQIENEAFQKVPRHNWSPCRCVRLIATFGSLRFCEKYMFNRISPWLLQSMFADATLSSWSPSTFLFLLHDCSSTCCLGSSSHFFVNAVRINKLKPYFFPYCSCHGHCWGQDE